MKILSGTSNLKLSKEIAKKLDIPENSLEPFGHHKAKISLDFIAFLFTTFCFTPSSSLILISKFL